MEDSVFYILIRSWKAHDNFDRCIDSVLMQTYKNFKILFVDDASGLTATQKSYIKNKLKGHLVKFNKKRLYSLRNAYELLKGCPDNENAVVFNLDGDDWLPNGHSLEAVAKTYASKKACLLTYGECLVWDNGKLSDQPAHFILPNANLAYPKSVITSGMYRREPFYPFHPRTWKLWLFKKINKTDFLRPDGNWLQFAEDQAIFFPMLEMSGGNFQRIDKPIYVHNFEHKHSDLKANLFNLVKDELIIRIKPKYEPIP